MVARRRGRRRRGRDLRLIVRGDSSPPKAPFQSRKWCFWWRSIPAWRGREECGHDDHSRAGHDPVTVRTEHDGPVTIVTIDRPATRNAVDRATADLLLQAFQAFDADETQSVAVLYGEGGTFCSGADLKAMDQRLEPHGPGPMGPTRMRLSKPVDRRHRGVRRGRRARAGDLVRPAGGRPRRQLRRLLPPLGRPAHRRRHGPAAPADRHRPGDGPDPHRPRGRGHRGRADGAGQLGRRARRRPRGGAVGRVHAGPPAAGLPAQRPALDAGRGGPRGRGRDAYRVPVRPRLARHRRCHGRGCPVRPGRRTRRRTRRRIRPREE